jgi:hypothetical protein
VSQDPHPLHANSTRAATRGIRTSSVVSNGTGVVFI